MAILDLANLGTRGFIIQGDAAGDLAGGSVASAGDINGDGYGDVIVGADAGDDGGASAGEAYVIFGKASGFGPVDLGNIGAAGFVIQGDAALDKAGFSVASAGDVNGDGLGDVIVGAPFGDDGGTDAGEAYVIFGKAGGFGTIDLTNLGETAGFVIQGDEAGDNVGHSVASAGDFNHDGIDDLIVGAPGGEFGGSNAGEAYVIFGKSSGLGDIDLTSLAAEDGFVIGGLGAASFVGRSVASAGDVNGDGVDDIVLGVAYGDAQGDNSGQAYILFGKSAGLGDVDLATLDPDEGFLIEGGLAFGKAGWSAASAGDVNGDGFDDVIVGQPNLPSETSGNAGAAYLVFGKADGFGTLNLAAPDPDAVVSFFGASGGDQVGWSVAAAGDVNADGFADFILGSSTNTGAGAGKSYLIYGKAEPFDSIHLAGLRAADGFLIRGVTSNDQAGRSVSSAGDVNGDGFADLLLGAQRGDDGGVDAGQAYVIFGAAPTAAVTRVGSAAAQTIRGGTGDDLLDGRDGGDLLFGAGGDDRLVGGAGDDGLSGDAGDDDLSGGSGNDSLNGGFDNDRLAGGSGNDLVDGGAGADLLIGGSGNDRYNVDRMGDRIVEEEGSGADRLFARANYTLRDGVDIETISTIANSGTATISLTGNEIANSITGNAGVNALAGGGGGDQLFGLAGNDRLSGGAGNDLATGGAGTDRFLFDTALSATANVDRLLDFSPTDDMIALDRAIFGGIPSGVLTAAAFRAGAAAQDDSDRIVYDAATGNIYYDADGLNGAAQILFAQVDAGTPLTRVDFLGFDSGSAAAARLPQSAFAPAPEHGQGAGTASRSLHMEAVPLSGPEWMDVQIA